MVLFEKDELKLLWPFYLNAFLGISLFIFIPFEVLYFQSIGFTLTQIGFLTGAVALFSFLFEIPTGAIADIYGRKVSVVIGFLLNGILFGFIYFLTSFYGALIVYSLIGVARTLSSGSFDAWVIDLVKQKKRENLIKEYFSKYHALGGIGVIIAGLLGTFIVAQYGLKFIWFVTCFGGILSALIILFFSKEKFTRSNVKIKESFNQLYVQSRDSIKYSYKHKILFVLLLITLILPFINSLSAFLSWTPLLYQSGLKEAYFGYLWGVLGILGALASILSPKLTKKFKERNVLIVTSFLALIFSALVLAFNNLYALLALFFIGSAIFSFEYPIWNTYFHKFIPSKMRATIGSINGMLYCLSAAISMPLAGFLVDKIGSKYTILISGLLMIPVIILYLSIKEKSSKNI